MYNRNIFTKKMFYEEGFSDPEYSMTGIPGLVLLNL